MNYMYSRHSDRYTNDDIYLGKRTELKFGKSVLIYFMMILRVAFIVHFIDNTASFNLSSYANLFLHSVAGTLIGNILLGPEVYVPPYSN